MRKYILFLLFACLHLAARGQTMGEVEVSGLPQRTQAAGLQYWFDDDKGSLSTSQQVNGTHLLDASSLLTGLHALHYQIIDNTGKVAVPYSALFLKTAQYEHETANGLQYWVDDDAQSLKKTSLQNGVSTIDVSTTLEGLHTLHFQILDSHGMPSAISSAIFMKMGKSMGEGSLRAERMIYWYDEEEQVHEAELNGEVKMLDASHLTEGLHTLHYQVLCNNGALTASRSAFFFRVSYDSNSTKAHALRYWYDDQTTVLTAPIGGGAQMLDVADLMAGLHVLHVQIENESGDLGVPSSTMFLKMDMMAELAAAQSQRYWFDEDVSQMRECAVTNGVQQLDVKGLSTGFHTLHYQLVDGAGNVTVPYSGFFMKMAECDLADGKNAIIRYQYWLNEDSELTTVDVSKPTNPFQLISLLPIESLPIRSSCFHFEAKEGVPMIYAKNDVHFRFYDAFEAFGDENAQFIDYNVSQKVTDITPLQETQTFARPEENSIKWFSFEAEVGDSVAFRLDQAATIQVFAPDNTELLSSSESQSVAYKGCHITMNGTYYVAIHDLTGTRLTNMSLYFQHIPKYCVLSHTPGVVGAMPNSFFTMKLFGNGYDLLKSASLENESCQIAVDSLYALNRSNAELYFSIQENVPPTGNYNLHLWYEDEGATEDIIVHNAVTIEPGVFGDIEVSIVEPARAGNPYPVSIHIKNTGNVGYTMIPLNVAFDNISQIKEIHYKDFAVAMPKDVSDAGYNNIEVCDSILGGDQAGAVMFFYIPRLEAYQELTMTFMLTTPIPSFVNVYAWGGEPMELSRSTKNMARAATRPNTSNHGENMLNFGDNMENITGSRGMPNVVSATGRGSNLVIKGGVAIGTTVNATGRLIGEISIQQLGTDDGTADYIRDVYAGLYPEIYTPGHIWGGHVGEWLDNLLNWQRQAPRSDTPNPGSPREVETLHSYDPNDILGYVSESGSHFIRKEIASIPYEIEFENDPEFANAPAYHVVIKDTLDATLFDLSTFAPKSIKIGENLWMLDGRQSFVQTFDLRTRINAIAQVSLDYDSAKGIATWDILSLDPMTMEPTQDIMQGILPVNYDGESGEGLVAFDIALRQPLTDGTEIPNQASIVFDNNDAILTPTWTNIVDAVAPKGSVIEVTQQGDSATIVCDGTDERSGIWKYEIYAQSGTNAPWLKVGECFADSAKIRYEVFDGLDYGFCALAVDSAGNVEQKELVRELSLNPVCILGDVNGDTSVTYDDVSGIVNLLLQIHTEGLNASAADVNQDGVISVDDIVKLINMIEDSEIQNHQSHQMETNLDNSELEAFNNIIHELGIESYSIPVKR